MRAASVARCGPRNPVEGYAASSISSTYASLSFAFSVVVRYVGTIPEFSASLARQSILVRPHQKPRSLDLGIFHPIGQSGYNLITTRLMVEALGTAPKSWPSSVNITELKSHYNGKVIGSQQKNYI